MTGNMVDKTWNCGCGALNSGTRLDCGACGKEKTIENE